jgi:hypothetical protein
MRRLALTLSVLSCGFLTWAGCERGAPSHGDGDAASQTDAQTSGRDAPPAPPPSQDSRAWFTEVAAEVGLDFVHSTGATGEYFFPEIAASGCALFDYDHDGDLDAYFLQCFPLAELVADPAKKRKSDDPAAASRLYRNDLAIDADGSRKQWFVDVTHVAGVGNGGYGMGCAVGDYDNDGDIDLFVTNFGPDVLYQNNGDGTFTDVSDAIIGSSPVIPRDERWSTSASFVDFDADGWLDLFHTNYVRFSVLENKVCHSTGGRRDYCGPSSFEPVPDRLLRNRGDGTFEDVTVSAGIDRAFGSGLGVITADFDRDGRVDIYVANDGNANQLWMNRGEGTFENTALLAGAAYNSDGMPEAGMGVDAADFDLDADDDIFISHLDGEHNTLYLNDGRAIFADRTAQYGLDAMSRPLTGFGTAWCDFDADADLDIFVANGAVRLVQDRAGEANPFAQRNLLIRNLGPPAYHFDDITLGSEGGAAMALVETSRGAAFGDIDNDGDIDILMTNKDGPVRLFRNEIGSTQGWIMLQLEGRRSNRSGIGAEVILERDGRSTQRSRCHSDGSYCSASDLRVHFGLGADRSPQSVVVRWPSGLVERFGNLAVQQQHLLVEGAGKQVQPDS